VYLLGREFPGAFPCRLLSEWNSVGPIWPGSASFSTAAPMPRCCRAGWLHRRLLSRGPPHWPPLYSGPASSRATARHPSIGTDPETGVACQLLLCWLSPAGRLASGVPVRQRPAEVACAGCVLPSRPSPCSGLSPPLSTLRDTTPPPHAVGCPCDRTPPPAWACATAVRRLQHCSMSVFPLPCLRSCMPYTDVFHGRNVWGLPSSSTPLFLHATA